MILIIRGHIRDSFNSQNLYNLIKDISLIDPYIKIYIHTWNIFANSLSWRQVNTDNTLVTNETIYTYFKDLKDLIKCIIIDDDTKIKLIGKIDNPKCPKGWKNYIYGKYKIIDHLYNLADTNNEEMVITCRFDVSTNSNPITHNDIINFINKNTGVKFNKNIFLRDYEFNGIDNIYIGNVDTIHKLTHYFHTELDKILSENIYHNHECLWYRMNILLFDKTPKTLKRAKIILIINNKSHNKSHNNKLINRITKSFFSTINKRVNV
jgi:hypothetical protein